MENHHKQNGVHLKTEKRDTDQEVELKSSNLGKHGATMTTAFLSVLAVTLAVVCAVFRTSLYHHGQSFWVSSGDFIARQWGTFYNYFDGNMAKMGLALHLLSMLEHWLLGGVFLFMDLTGKPKFITKYKVQLDQTEIPGDKLRRTLWTVFLNQTVYSLPILVGMYYVAGWRGCGVTVDEIPTFQTVLFHFAVFVIVEEFGFYYSHRLLHHPWLYKSIHKIHHEWTAPIGLVSLYSHPIENFFSNTFPAVLGVVITGSHMLTASVWLRLALLVTTISHSGYHLPLLPSPEFHDYHHLKFTNCYGVLGILDWLHGTDINFRKSKQFQRHKALLGITPLNETIPDQLK